MQQKVKFSEGRILFVIAMVQFIHALDFMMVMPLGPDFAAALGIPLQHLGYIGGAYTMSAAIAGLIGALFLDRFDRKRVITIALLGLSLATILPAFATSAVTLISARALAGMFGGPLAALTTSMLVDIIPAERRGAAMGKVMGAFSLAVIVGLPFSLELSRLFSWQMPFIILGLMAFAVYFVALRFLPKNTNEISKHHFKSQAKQLSMTLRNPLAWSAWSIMIIAMIAAFMIVPNLSAHIQYDMGFPRDKLSLMFLLSGSVSFFTTRFIGKIVDRTSATFASILSTVLYVITILFGFIYYRHGLTPIFFHMFFTISMSARNIAAQTLSTQVPLAAERAGFMSIQGSMNSASSAIGAFISSMILIEKSDKTLMGTNIVGWIAIIISLFIPILFWNTERLLKRRTQQQNITVSKNEISTVAPTD